jgi:hypothetical protein
VIKEIEISGFRGILSPLKLKFNKDQYKTNQSMIIYGRNGAGKSSITDAWEWFQFEKINHLAREGAQQNAYPHLQAKPSEIYIQVQFDDSSLNTIKVEFDTEKITKPIVKGNISRFRELAVHPCQIRFEDLTRFVYFNKSERYDQLANLMGFTPQVEFQKTLRKVENSLEDKFTDVQKEVQNIKRDLEKTLDIDSIDINHVLTAFNKIIEKHGFANQPTISKIKIINEEIKQKVEIDPNANELVHLTSINEGINQILISDSILLVLNSYLENWDNYEQIAKESLDLLMINLFENGEKVLAHRIEIGENISFCPLCGEHYSQGNLREHVSNELLNLTNIKLIRDKYFKSKNDTEKVLPSHEYSELLLPYKADKYLEYSISILVDSLKKVDESIGRLKIIFNKGSTEIDSKIVAQIRLEVEEFKSSLQYYETTQTTYVKKIKDRITILENDSTRKRLVDDYTKINSALLNWEKFAESNTRMLSLKNVWDSYKRLVDDFVLKAKTAVAQRFDCISDNVQKYFQILEEYTPGIGKPVLKLSEDQDRAVELEVEFFGEPIIPAYKYLSESQLNSFGLAIFLASVRYFNNEFHFVILDDVINSFDGYKRPQVIKLLKNEFSDFQILLLTHDSVWKDRLYESCPSWIKREFIRNDPAIGPIDTEGFTPLEEIEKLIINGKPVLAGQYMGAYLERQLQEICERFDVFVKYNRKNEYTISPLFDRLRLRIQEKLGETHPLYISLIAFKEDLGFRNLCSHWKNPDIQLTEQEMQAVVNKWKIVQEKILCGICNEYATYDGKQFTCSCGNIKIIKII